MCCRAHAALRVAIGIAVAVVTQHPSLRLQCVTSVDRHRDNTTPDTTNRRFALTLNLNSDEYDGGEL
jgi:hypothetical protein